ncbi:MAG: ExbD/TolR family protein [Aquificaceae bacterium]
MKRKAMLMLLMEEEHHKEEIQIIPMIDVMLFLLVFFMVYTLNVFPMMLQDIKIPSSSTVERKDIREPIKVYINREGKVMLEDKREGLEALRSLLTSLPQKEKASVIIVGDKEVNLQRVLEVIDVIKDAGIYQIGIVGDKK